MEIMSYEKKSKELTLIPKYEFYMEYMLEVILLHLPRTEKFSIGTEFKSVMYDTFKLCSQKKQHKKKEYII